LVDKEGPIHKEVVKRRIAKLLQVRMGRKIGQRLDFAIFEAGMNKNIKIDGDFLWSPTMKQATLRVCLKGNYNRSIEEVPPQEISLAIIECVKNSMSISEDDLVRETARLFGLRATSKVSARIWWIMNSMLTNNHLERKAGKIMMSK